MAKLKKPTELIEASLLEVRAKVAREEKHYGWTDHFRAWKQPVGEGLGRTPKRQREIAIRNLIQGLAGYVESHEGLYEAPVSDDYYTGPIVKQIAEGLIGLLNTETGGFECGTLDGLIRKIVESAGVELDK